MDAAAATLDWLERTLEARCAGFGDSHRLAVMQSLRDALAADRTLVFGAALPSEHVGAVKAAMVPRLEDRIAALRAAGVEAPKPPARVRKWPERSRDALRTLERVIATLARDPDRLGPFVRAARLRIGGLRSAGFSSDGGHVLVCSTNGRGVFDARTGERMARDPAPFEVAHGRALGIAPIAGESIAVMGIDGDAALPRETPDGWRLGVARPDWEGAVWLCPPGVHVEAPTPACVTLGVCLEEIRAAGFSSDGRGLLVAEQHTLHLFARDA